MLRAHATRNGPIILAQSAAPVSVTGTTAETTLASITIPGGTMGVNGIIRISALFSMTNNANGKTMTVRIGGAQVFANGTNNVTTYTILPCIRNRNSLTSQVTNIANAAGTAAVASTTSVNTAVDQTLTITATLGVGTDTITLEGYTVEVLPA